MLDDLWETYNEANEEKKSIGDEEEGPMATMPRDMGRRKTSVLVPLVASGSEGFARKPSFAVGRKPSFAVGYGR